MLSGIIGLNSFLLARVIKVEFGMILMQEIMQLTLATGLIGANSGNYSESSEQLLVVCGFFDCLMYG